MESLDTRPVRLGEARKKRAGRVRRLELGGTGGAEVARVLGGGAVPGSLVLVGGEPGIGKSTLMLQVAVSLARGAAADDAAALEGAGAAGGVLYVSGEESVQQLAARAARLEAGADEAGDAGGAGAADDGLYLQATSKLDEVLAEIAELQPRAVVVDSIQTLYLAEATGSAGSVSQVRECATALLQVAKRLDCAVFIVGHVTKSGDVAGPRVLEHIVDVVLYLEGERYQRLRLLRGLKNRFGATDELGVFQMEEAGMVAVQDPSSAFFAPGAGGAEGSGADRRACAVAATVEGSRPLLVEVQALSSHVPKDTRPAIRQASGVPKTRMDLLLAVLGKRAKCYTWGQDIFVNVAGGLRLEEPAADLAVAAALASAVLERSVRPRTAFAAEIGLGGELRPVRNLKKRLAEAEKMGFKLCVVPAGDGEQAAQLAKGGSGLKVLPCATLSEALDATLLPGAKQRGRQGGGD